MNNKNKIKNLILSVLILFTFFCMYKAGIIYPIFGDDWEYAFIWGTNERVSGISDIIYSQYKHYLEWGGRSITHFIAQSLLSLEVDILRVSLNAAVYTLLTVIIYLLSTQKDKPSVTTYIFISSLLWLCTPMLSCITMWVTGSSNYLWSSLIVILFLYPYLNSLKNDKIKKSKTFTIFFPLLAIVAGWCNEAASIGVIVFLAIYLFIFYKRRELQQWMTVGTIFFFIGSVFMFAAPGNFRRLEASQDLTSGNNGFISNIFHNLGLLCEHLFLDSYMWILIVLLFVLLLYLLFIQKQPVQSLLMPLATIFIGSVAAAAMICSPQFPIRTLFFSLICLLIATARLYSLITFKNKQSTTINILFVAILFGIFVWDWNGRINSLQYISDFWKKRVEYVEEQKKESIYDIVFEEQYPYLAPPYTNAKYYIYDLRTNSANWVNQAYSKYYGIKSVRVKE